MASNGHVRQCPLGCPKMQLFFMSRCIWWVRLLENDFTFTIFDFVHYSSARCSKTKTKFADFWKFYYTTFLVNLHHFSYFDPTKNPQFFFKTIFSGIIHWLRPWKKSAHAHNVVFWCWFLSIARSNSWRNRK